MNDSGQPWEETGEKVLWVPIGPWPDTFGAFLYDVYEPCVRWYLLVATKRDQLAAELMRQDVLHVGQSVRPVLLLHGFPEDAIDQCIRSQEVELRSLSIKTYLKVRSKD